MRQARLRVSFAGQPNTTSHRPYWRRVRPSTLGRLRGIFQKFQDLWMQMLVGGQNMAAVQRLAATVEVAHHAAGLAHEENPGRDIPGVEPALPEGVESPRRD